MGQVWYGFHDEHGLNYVLGPRSYWTWTQLWAHLDTHLLKIHDQDAEVVTTCSRHQFFTIYACILLVNYCICAISHFFYMRGSTFSSLILHIFSKFGFGMAAWVKSGTLHWGPPFEYPKPLNRFPVLLWNVSPTVNKNITYSFFNMGKSSPSTGARIIASTTPSGPTLWSIWVDSKTGIPDDSHWSQVWHPSKWIGPLNWLCTHLDGESLWVVDQVLRMMIQAFVTIHGHGGGDRKWAVDQVLRMMIQVFVTIHSHGGEIFRSPWSYPMWALQGSVGDPCNTLSIINDARLMGPTHVKKNFRVTFNDTGFLVPLWSSTCLTQASCEWEL